MNALITALCLCGLFVPTAIGVGISMLLVRWVGNWAYVLGWLVPVLALIGLYAIYGVWIRITPCEPAGSLACGEPLAYALILFLGVLCLTALGNALAQGAVFFYLRAQPPPQAYPEEEYAPEAYEGLEGYEGTAGYPPAAGYEEPPPFGTPSVPE